MSSNFITVNSDGNLLLKLYIQPNAPRNQVIGIHNDRLKLKISSPAIENAANQECVKYLSSLLKTGKSNIQLVKGHKSRNKIFLISNILKEHPFFINLQPVS
ncbi:MAG: YggU family protein [Nitrospinae bacterium]|nr:YggU family protein [Nitrospinota bacterium]